MATNPAKRGALRALSLTMTALVIGATLLPPAATASPALALPLDAHTQQSACRPLEAPTIIPDTTVLGAPVCIGFGNPGDPNGPLDFIICGPYGTGTGCCWVTGTWYDPSTWSAGCGML